MTTRELLLSYIQKRASVSDTIKKLFEPAGTHKYVIPALDSILSHHTTAGLLGSGLGGLVGGIAGTKGKKNKAALTGALAGGGLGLAGSFAAPETSKQLNNALISKLVRQPLGLVATNLVDPMGYYKEGPGGTADRPDPRVTRIKSLSKPDIIHSIVNDTSRVDHGSGLNGIRDPIYRMSFDLPPRGPHSDMFVRDVSTNDLHFNPLSESGKKMIDAMGHSYDTSRWNDVLGNYATTKIKGKGVSYSDLWDFDLSPNEGLNTKANWIRYLVDRILNKQRVSGMIPVYTNDEEMAN